MTQLIGKLNSIVLAVSDMNKNIKFYRDILYHEKTKQTGGGSLPTFDVKNIKKTVAVLKKKKVKFINELYEKDYGWIAVFSDPDGYGYELFQEN